MDLSFDFLLKYKWPLYQISSWSQEYPRETGELDCNCCIRCELLGSCSHSWRTSWSQSGTMKERENMDPSSSYFLESASTATLSFSFLVNDLMIISKELGHPYLLLRGGKALIQKILEALMTCLNLEAFPQ